jgi:hypothetical protein
LRVGEADVRVVSTAERSQCRGDASGDALGHGVSEPTFEVGDPRAEALGTPGGDASVGEQEPVDVVAAHQADDGRVDGLGVDVVEALTEPDHLAEDLSGLDDRGGQGPAVEVEAVKPDAAALEDEQDLTGWPGEVSNVPAGTSHIDADRATRSMSSGAWSRKMPNSDSLQVRWGLDQPSAD